MLATIMGNEVSGLHGSDVGLGGEGSRKLPKAVEEVMRQHEECALSVEASRSYTTDTRGEVLSESTKRYVMHCPGKRPREVYSETRRSEPALAPDRSRSDDVDGGGADNGDAGAGGGSAGGVEPPTRDPLHRRGDLIREMDQQMAEIDRWMRNSGIGGLADLFGSARIHRRGRAPPGAPEPPQPAEDSEHDGAYAMPHRYRRREFDPTQRPGAADAEAQRRKKEYEGQSTSI